MLRDRQLTISSISTWPVLAFYRILPPWAQDVAISLYGAHLRFRRRGKLHDRELKRLTLSQWVGAEVQLERQLEHLRAVVAQAYADVPFYRGRGPAPPIESIRDIASLPIISKRDVRAAGKNLISGVHGRLVTIHTGGSTGTPLSIFCDRLVLQRNYAYFERLKHWTDAGSQPRIATFAGRNIVPSDATSNWWRRNRAMNTMLFSSYHLSPATAPAYVAQLARFSPNLIDTYPSSLELIARHLVESGNRSIRPAAIITSSETLLAETRALFEQAFGCPVFDHYGSAEMVAFISQCERGSYHVNPEFGIVELLRDGVPVGPGELGEIVATGFINPVMPLLRYAMGDQAAWGREPCPCGRAFPVIERIEGRMDDVIITPDGRHVGRLDPIFKSVSAIQEARIIQDARDHITVETVTAAGLPPREEEVLRAELGRRLGREMRVDFRSVPNIPRTVRGKLRTVVNLYNNPSADRA